MSGRSRTFVFLALVPLVYGAIVASLAVIDGGGAPLIEVLIGNARAPGGRGHALLRFRDVERFADVDLLFIGSSHAYRGFDPRVFAGHGLSSFNLGSTAQAPGNTYFLLKRYWPRLRPRVVVMEAYPVAFTIDGLESFYDLVVNTSFSVETLEMAFALRNPHAVTAMLGTAAARLRWPLDDAPQQPTPGDTYVAGGYTESAIRGRAEELVTRPTTIRFADEQLRYLTRIVRFSTERGAKVVVVINPIGSRTTRAITNYWQVSGRLADLARASGALFWDFNGEVPLDDDDFKDADHLNASGVGKFNRAFVERLKLHGLAAPRDRASGR